MNFGAKFKNPKDIREALATVLEYSSLYLDLKSNIDRIWNRDSVSLVSQRSI